MANLQLFPSRWTYHFGFDLTNEIDGMHIWIANEYYGISFCCKGRKWGGVNVYGSVFDKLIRWRRVMYDVAQKQAALPCVTKIGFMWSQMTEEQRKIYESR